jgi:hypothetical protein
MSSSTDTQTENKINDATRTRLEKLCSRYEIPDVGYPMFYVGVDGVYCHVCKKNLKDNPKYQVEGKMGSFCRHGATVKTTRDLDDMKNRLHHDQEY